MTRGLSPRNTIFSNLSVSILSSLRWIHRTGKSSLFLAQGATPRPLKAYAEEHRKEKDAFIPVEDHGHIPQIRNQKVPDSIMAVSAI